MMTVHSIAKISSNRLEVVAILDGAQIEFDVVFEDHPYPQVRAFNLSGSREVERALNRSIEVPSLYKLLWSYDRGGEVDLPVDLEAAAPGWHPSKSEGPE